MYIYFPTQKQECYLHTFLKHILNFKPYLDIYAIMLDKELDLCVKIGFYTRAEVTD